MEYQQLYWNRVAAQKMFTHPLDQGWLDISIPKTARILDYGCGYGRILAELDSKGYTNTVGMDTSAAMVERGRRAFPKLDIRVIQGLPVEEADASFDAILLLAVLTCLPHNEEQDVVMREVRRLLRPGGMLYLSDMPLQADSRNRIRYARDAPRFGTYGVFETDDGAVVRHHDKQRLGALLAGFETVATATIAISTMNGHPAAGVQMLARVGRPGNLTHPD